MSARRSAPPASPAPQVFYIFDAPPRLDAIGGKIRELSSGLSESPATADTALSEAELAPGGVLDALLSRCVARARYQWSPPGVLDRVFCSWLENAERRAFWWKAHVFQRRTSGRDTLDECF